MNEGEWTTEAVIGLICLIVAVLGLATTIIGPRNPLVVDDVVQTRAADVLTQIPTQTPWVVTVTATPTPTPLPTPIQKNHPR